MISGAAALAGLGSAAAFLATTAGRGPWLLRRLRRSAVVERGQRAGGAVDVRHRGRLVSVLAGLAAWQLLGGVPGMVAGSAAVVLLPRLLARLEPASTRAERDRMTADLPVALDLLAACLSAGADPHRGLVVVAAALGGPLGRRLDVVAAHIRLGADPAKAWTELGELPGLGGLGRSIARSLDSGAAWAPVLERAARDLRVRRRLSGEAAARAVAVRAVAPLGACFLPAFVLLGIVPTVWGFAATTFSGRF